MKATRIILLVNVYVISTINGNKIAEPEVNSENYELRHLVEWNQRGMPIYQYHWSRKKIFELFIVFHCSIDARDGINLDLKMSVSQ